MRLNVTNPSLWPAAVQDLRLMPDPDVPGGQDVDAYTMVSGDRLLAILERCEAEEWAMIMEHGEEVRIPVSEAWELEILGDDGNAAGQRMFIPTARVASTPGAADPGVLTWAAFGIVWDVAGRQPGRG